MKFKNYLILCLLLNFSTLDGFSQYENYDKKIDLTGYSRTRDGHVTVLIKDSTYGMFTGQYIVDDSIAKPLFGWYNVESSKYQSYGITFYVKNGEDFQQAQLFVGKFNFDRTKIIGRFFYWGNEYGFYGDVEYLSNYNSIESPVSESNLIDVYPNPVGDFLKIDLKDKLYKSIEIYNLNGELIIQAPAKDRINVNSLNTGAYILKLLLENEMCESIKFIKE